MKTSFQENQKIKCTDKNPMRGLYLEHGVIIEVSISTVKVDFENGEGFVDFAINEATKLLKVV